MASGDGRLRTFPQPIDFAVIVRGNTLRDGRRVISTISIDVHESFLITFWNHPSFFSRSGVDSSDVSLQHQG
jgi:hypothetical protein